MSQTSVSGFRGHSSYLQQIKYFSNPNNLPKYLYFLLKISNNIFWVIEITCETLS